MLKIDSGERLEKNLIHDGHEGAEGAPSSACPCQERLDPLFVSPLYASQGGEPVAPRTRDKNPMIRGMQRTLRRSTLGDHGAPFLV